MQLANSDTASPVALADSCVACICSVLWIAKKPKPASPQPAMAQLEWGSKAIRRKRCIMHHT
jgi:hypothetical protein